MSDSDPDTTGSDATLDAVSAEALARARGFGRAAALFPGDVQAAARRAAALRAEIGTPSDAPLEPWPPMRCPIAP